VAGAADFPGAALWPQPRPDSGRPSAAVRLLRARMAAARAVQLFLPALGSVFADRARGRLLSFRRLCAAANLHSRGPALLVCVSELRIRIGDRGTVTATEFLLAVIGPAGLRDAFAAEGQLET
jgi:hypothetical protein